MRGARRLLALAAILATASLAASHADVAPQPPPVEAGDAPQPLLYAFPTLGAITVYRPAAAPRAVVMLLSGEGGWTPAMARMANAMAGRGALVAGISTPAFVKALDQSKRCINPNYALLDLSRDIQHRMKLPLYLKPVLAGAGSGASLGYGALAAGPNGAYKAVLSLGFRPQMAGTASWCKSGSLALRGGGKGARSWTFAPAIQLPSPWIVLQGPGARRMRDDALRAFLARVPDGRLVPVRSGGLPEMLAEIAPLLTPAVQKAEGPHGPALPPDLPLNIVADPAAPRTDMMAVLYSGDGGWVGLDKDVAGALAKAGVPVVGMDSLSYFWSARTPAGAAADLDAIIRSYSARWERPRVLLVGYSFGADVLPHIVEHLPATTRAQVVRLAMMGLSLGADFQFHLSSWLDVQQGDAYPTIPAIERLKGLEMLCVRGQQEDDSACPAIPRGLAYVATVPGGHHFNRNAPLLARYILGGLAPASAPR